MMKKNTYKGTAISAGIATGKCMMLERQNVPVFRLDLEEHEIEAEVGRIKEAIEKSRTQITALKEQLSARLGQEHSYIMDVQLMMLKDDLLVATAIDFVRKEKVNAEWALHESAAKLTSIFNNMKDGYIRERVVDVEDVVNRIQANIAQINVHHITEVEEDVIILAYQLSPSDIVEIHDSRVVGFVTELGGKTSHTAIIARSLETPAVAGIEDLGKVIKSGQTLIVDGYEGILIVDPTPTQQREYENKKRYYEEHATQLMLIKDRPAITKDRRKLVIQANIELPEDVDAAIRSGAEGIGIYRSEFLYLSNPDTLPTEEEHFDVYRALAEKVHPYSAIVRTADLGAEKFTPVMGMHHEPNPALGLRGIRFCLQKKELFRIQLRALLRASVYGRLKIMFPMVSGVSELREAKAVLEEVKEQLTLEKKEFNENIAVGIMMEVPSAALSADVLAQEVDFFSIGTNDLIQYLLAIDRNNEHVAKLFDPLHPPVLEALRLIVDAAHRHAKPVSVCGEAAGDPALTILLIAMRVDSLSVSAGDLPRVKWVIRTLSWTRANELWQQARTMEHASEIRQLMEQELAQQGLSRLVGHGK